MVYGTKQYYHVQLLPVLSAWGCIVPIIQHSLQAIFSSLGKIFVPKEKPIETHTEEKVTLDPELEEALASASDTELYDLAG